MPSSQILSNSSIYIQYQQSGELKYSEKEPMLLNTGRCNANASWKSMEDNQQNAFGEWDPERVAKGKKYDLYHLYNMQGELTLPIKYFVIPISIAIT